MPGFWDNFGRSAVSSMQQTAPYGLEILRNKASAAQAAQQAREKQIQELLGVAQGMPVGDPGRNDALNNPLLKDNPVASALGLQKPKYDPDVFKTEYETLMKLPQAKRAELVQKLKETGAAEKYGPLFQTLEYGALVPDKMEPKIVGNAVLVQNPETGKFEVAYKPEPGWTPIPGSFNEATNTVSLIKDGTNEIKTHALPSYSRQSVKDDNIITEQIGPEGTKITDIKVAPSGEKGASFNNLMQLHRQYQTESRTFKAVRDGYMRVKEAANSNTAPGDVSLLFGYMKILDPGSVVRETEFATAENAQGIPDKIRNFYNRAMTGERLPPEVRQGFLAESKILYRGQLDQHKKTAKQYANMASRHGMNPEDVVFDLQYAEPPSLNIQPPANGIKYTEEEFLSLTPEQQDYITEQAEYEK